MSEGHATKQNSLGTLAELQTSAGPVAYHRLAALDRDLTRTPLTIKVLLEAALRSEDGVAVTADDARTLARYDARDPEAREVPFTPARVLVQDFTGVPALVDLAAMRSAMARLGGDPERVNPQIPVDLVIDHSVAVDHFGSADALSQNAFLEFSRNKERYEFLHWGQQAFQNLSVVPPASGICHQVNLEYLGKVVQQRDAGLSAPMAYPDSLVGLDSHTTMIGGLGIIGWGVGGIEAEAVMLGQPLYMLLPKVVGVKLTGTLAPGSTATDLALVITELLRSHGVVGKFVEFYGPGLSSVSLADRATVANMAPEYGATVGYFPVDDETLRYMRRTGRPQELLDLVERYTKEQGLFRTDDTVEPVFSETLELDLSTVQPSLAGPRRPQDRLDLPQVQGRWQELMTAPRGDGGFAVAEGELEREVPLADANGGTLTHGDIVIAAITSCTNTSNPSVLLTAGLLAKKAVEAGLSVKPHVKTSLAPGSKVVTEYLQQAGLLTYLEQLGFHVVGYGCTTCIGNSGPLPEPVEQAIEDGGLVTASVLSGNRNFEGRIHARIMGNFLASPPLVVAYALAGTVDIDLTQQPIAQGRDGQDVLLQDIWPGPEEVGQLLEQATDPETFRAVYDRLLVDNETWNAIEAGGSALYPWDGESTYIQEPPFFTDMSPEPAPVRSIEEARVLVKVADSVTTDHISPAGSIPEESPAGHYLVDNGVDREQFNSYGSRRGNDRVMTRGTFANIRLKNRLANGKEGGWTTHLPSGELTSIHEAAGRYREEGTPLVVIAGADYGMGSSRDWAAKGTHLLGVRAVLARSFERIHRSNLVGMGVLPLQFVDDADADGLTGQETFTIELDDGLSPGQLLEVQVDDDDSVRSFEVRCRLDTRVELLYYRNGGILQTVLRRMM